MKLQKILYAVSGVVKRFSVRKVCPSCQSCDSIKIDRKYFHHLLRCKQCGLLYRFPYETEDEMKKFYQYAYKQRGLTTDLPSDQELERLKDSQFKNTSKDFNRVIELLNSLGVKEGARILDFGANWGYATWQFNNAGFISTGFELSKPRAEFGKKLNVNIYSSWKELVSLSGKFDVVFSSHVLEHTPNPSEAIQRQVSVLKPGGLIVSYVPNGSVEFSKADPSGFHALWGMVHPVMIDKAYIQKRFSHIPSYVGSHTNNDLKNMETWNRSSSVSGKLDTGELLFILAPVS